MTTRMEVGDLPEAEYHDARALAIEFAAPNLSTRFDPMTAGVVLQPGEIVYRRLPIWLRVLADMRWAEASFADVLVTDRRLLCRFSTVQFVFTLVERCRWLKRRSSD